MIKCLNRSLNVSKVWKCKHMMNSRKRVNLLGRPPTAFLFPIYCSYFDLIYIFAYPQGFRYPRLRTALLMKPNIQQYKFFVKKIFANLHMFIGKKKVSNSLQIVYFFMNLHLESTVDHIELCKKICWNKCI